MDAQALIRYGEFREYPFLTDEEFELACHYLDNRYMHSNLGPKRRSFKLRVQRSLAGGTPYVTIITPITIADDNIDELLDLSVLSAGDRESDTDMDGLQSMDIEGEDADMVCPSLLVSNWHIFN